jgi:cytohesin
MKKIFFIFIFLILIVSIFANDQEKLNKDFYKAVKDSDLAKAKKLLAEGADINCKSESTGWTPLMRSLFWKSTPEKKAMFFFLLENGADVKARNNSQGTALHVAVPFNDRVDEIEALIKAGADINAQNENGTTPLHSATFFNSLDVVKLLLKNKAEVNIQNKNGETPLMIGCQDKKSAAIVEMLINAKAKLDLKNKKGETALMLATKKKLTEIVDLLIKAGAKE